MKSPRIQISLKKNTHKEFVKIAEQKDLSLSALACSIIAEKIKSIPHEDEASKNHHREYAHA